MSIDSDLRHSPDLAPRPASTTSALPLGRDLRRTGTAPWVLWLGYLSLGGTMSYAELTDALAGTRPVSPEDLYLMVQARNV